MTELDNFSSIAPELINHKYRFTNALTRAANAFEIFGHFYKENIHIASRHLGIPLNELVSGLQGIVKEGDEWENINTGAYCMDINWGMDETGKDGSPYSKDADIIFRPKSPSKHCFDRKPICQYYNDCPLLERIKQPTSQIIYENVRLSQNRNIDPEETIKLLGHNAVRRGLFRIARRHGRSGDFEHYREYGFINLYDICTTEFDIVHLTDTSINTVTGTKEEAKKVLHETREGKVIHFAAHLHPYDKYYIYNPLTPSDADLIALGKLFKRNQRTKKGEIINNPLGIIFNVIGPHKIRMNILQRSPHSIDRMDEFDYQILNETLAIEGLSDKRLVSILKEYDIKAKILEYDIARGIDPILRRELADFIV